MQKCSICKLEKEDCEYTFRKDTGKLRRNCKDCVKIKRDAYLIKNKEIIYAKQKEYYAKNPEKKKEQDKKSRLKNIDRVRKNRKDYHAKNREAIQIKDRKRYKENASRNCKRQRELYIKDRENRLAYRRQYVKINKGKVRALDRSRELAKIQATPTWLNDTHKEEMSNIYQNSLNLTKDTGIQHNVDHIIPLRNDMVCGLHVPWNLQILTKEENSKKSNKLLPEYIQC